jgi:hypothetical protein
MRRFTVGWRYAKQSLAIVRGNGALTGLAAIGLVLGLGLAVVRSRSLCGRSTARAR